MIGEEEMILGDLAIPTIRLRPERITFEQPKRMPGIREERRKREEREADHEEDVLLSLTEWQAVA